MFKRPKPDANVVPASLAPPWVWGTSCRAQKEKRHSPKLPHFVTLHLAALLLRHNVTPDLKKKKKGKVYSWLSAFILGCLPLELFPTRPCHEFTVSAPTTMLALACLSSSLHGPLAPFPSTPLMKVIDRTNVSNAAEGHRPRGTPPAQPGGSIHGQSALWSRSPWRKLPEITAHGWENPWENLGFQQRNSNTPLEKKTHKMKQNKQTSKQKPPPKAAQLGDERFSRREGPSAEARETVGVRAQPPPAVRGQRGHCSLPQFRGQCGDSSKPYNKNYLPLGMYPKEMHSGSPREICAPKFLAAVSAIARTRRLPVTVCGYTDEEGVRACVCARCEIWGTRRKKVCHVHQLERTLKASH